MGGMIAAHLARKNLVDFLFVDRSFSALEEVPMYTMGGPWVKYAMRFFTMWPSTAVASRDYIFANCYKVVAQDPFDEVIDDNATLKTGISVEIVKSELKLR